MRSRLYINAKIVKFQNILVLSLLLNYNLKCSCSVRAYFEFRRKMFFIVYDVNCKEYI
jgi:hypothetical protein